MPDHRDPGVILSTIFLIVDQVHVYHCGLSQCAMLVMDGAGDSQGSLVACWEQYWTATGLIRWVGPLFDD